MTSFSVRVIRAEDIGPCCSILNEIIAAGGTTAFQQPFDTATFEDAYVNGRDHICCHVAVDKAGQITGFQWLGRHPKLPDDCGDIATFARRHPVLRGVGTALFAETRKVAQAQGLKQINAKIRADNRSGLGYYSKMGFADYAIEPSVPLADGTLVDRVFKRFTL